MLGVGGVIGVLAVVLGLGLFILGAIVAVQRGSRAHALALVVAAALPYLVGGIGTTLGQAKAQGEIIKLGPAVTPKDMAMGHQAALLASLFGASGSIIALLGAVAALSRSRPGSPLAPPPAE